MSESVIHVAAVADETFAPHLATLLRSIDDKRSTSVVVHVGSLGIDASTRRRVQLSAPGLDVCFYEIDPNELLRLPPSMSGTHRYAYGLLFLPDVLPRSLTRVVTIDVDTLVRDDLEELWTLDLENAPVAAAVDTTICHLGNPDSGLIPWQALGLDGRLLYLNSGVLVVDLDRWRTERVALKCLDFLERFGSQIRYADQDALNAVLAGSWKRLDARWNVSGDPFYFRYASTVISESEVERASSDPGIVHFAGGVKSWSWARAARSGLIAVDEWDKVALRTEFADWYQSQKDLGLAMLSSSPLSSRVVRAVGRRVRDAASTLWRGTLSR